MDRRPIPKGFTLIELLVVVVIVGVLVGLALPSYKNSTRRSHRSEAQQLMVDIANREEQYFMDAMSYTNSFTTLNFSKDNWTCAATTCTNTYYSVAVTLTAGPPPTFSITATPTDPSQTVDGSITLNSNGGRTLNGNAGW